VTMPYITHDDRTAYGPLLKQMELALAGKPKGHLTYVLYVIARRFVQEQRYATLSEARSAIGDAYDEFYRRLLAPYEDKQIEKNGDAE
jgi:hypothetical protein